MATWSANGTEIQSAAISITDANDVVGELYDRMLVILEREAEAGWLGADEVDDLQTLLDQFPGDRTKATRCRLPTITPRTRAPHGRAGRRRPGKALEFG